MPLFTVFEGRILEKGPKFGLEPCVAAHEMIAMNRGVAKRASQEAQERCLLEGMDCLHRQTPRSGGNPTDRQVSGVVKFFKDSGLKLVQADKDGGFVVLPCELYGDKAGQAVMKNFVTVKRNVARAKGEMLKLCKRYALDNLAKEIVKSKREALDIFFTAKTHKPSIPFRAIVSEKESWQRNVSRFLTKKLNLLRVSDPFMVKKSEDLIDCLQDNHNIGFHSQ